MTDIVDELRAEVSRLRSALYDIAESEPIPTPHEGWKFCRDTAVLALSPLPAPPQRNEVTK